MSRAVLVCSLGCIGALSAACTTAVEGGPDADVEETHAYLTVERTAAYEVPGTEAPVEVEEAPAALASARASASFLRTREGTDAEVVARLVGAALVMPEAVGCTSLDDDERGLALHTLSPVELAQAGDVTLASGRTRTPLAARAYPDVAHLVSGIVYTTPDVDGDLVTGERATVQVTGSPKVSPFEVEFAVPSPITGLTVAGRLASGTVSVDGGPVALGWDDAESDLVLVDVLTPSTRTRCTPEARTGTTLRTELLRDGDITLVVHRVRKVPFASGGLTSGSLQVDTASTVRLLVGEPG